MTTEEVLSSTANAQPSPELLVDASNEPTSNEDNSLLSPAPKDAINDPTKRPGSNAHPTEASTFSDISLLSPEPKNATKASTKRPSPNAQQSEGEPLTKKTVLAGSSIDDDVEVKQVDENTKDGDEATEAIDLTVGQPGSEKDVENDEMVVVVDEKKVEDSDHDSVVLIHSQ